MKTTSTKTLSAVACAFILSASFGYSLVDAQETSLPDVSGMANNGTPSDLSSPSLNDLNQSLSDSALSQTPANVFADIRFGTLGVGVEGGYIINEYLKIRGSFNYLGWSLNGDIDGNEYEGKYKNAIGGAFLDYHPFSGTFRLSAGLMVSSMNVGATASMADNSSLNIGDKQYGFDEISGANAKLTWNKVQPYVGIGWGASTESGFFFAADIGVLFIGSPNLSYGVNTNGTMSPAWHDELDRNIAKEKENVLDDIRKLKVFPVIMLGVGYSF